MSRLWDSPPLTIVGDDNDETTFAGVGRVLSRWEAVEFAFARLHSVFHGVIDGPEFLGAYGEGRIFKVRLGRLQGAADDFFIGHIDHSAEVNFQALVRAAEGFAERRNDVAHGVVMAISDFTIFRERMPADTPSGDRWALMPPLQTIKRHDDDGFPSYAYSSTELKELARLLAILSLEIGDYRKALIQSGA